LSAADGDDDANKIKLGSIAQSNPTKGFSSDWVSEQYLFDCKGGCARLSAENRARIVPAKVPVKVPVDEYWQSTGRVLNDWWPRYSVCLTHARKGLILLPFDSYEDVRLWWRGGSSGVVGSKKTAVPVRLRPPPQLNHLYSTTCDLIRRTVSGSGTRLQLNNYSGITKQLLIKTRLAVRLAWLVDPESRAVT